MAGVASVTDRTGGIWFELSPGCWSEGRTVEEAATNRALGDINSDWTREQIERVWGLR